MVRYIVAALTVAVLSTACESQTPTGPSATPPPEAAVPLTLPDGSGPALIPGTQIVTGAVAHGTVEASDPVCFRNWDARGRCRQFEYTVSTDASFRVTLSWPSRGVSDLELFLLSPDGTWVFSDAPWPERRLEIRGQAGQTYRIVVIGYQPPQPFEVLVEVQ